MSDDQPSEQLTARAQRMVSYRCSCGGDVRLASEGQARCGKCGRTITLRGLDANQTISFCSEIGSGTSFHLADGPDRSGESLGHFRLLSKLGYGGMGAVYRALDESLQRFVAVKVMRAADEGRGLSAKQVTRLLDEAVSQARLNHPNVVTIYYVGRDGEEPFFAMELLPGPTLGIQIKTEPLPYSEVILYAQQVVDALMQASRHGLVHGDIKPSNLILAGENTVKLGDFGLAKTEDTMPTTGISGTLSYMAPELSQGSAPSDQSDMYSLGVTLFELTFGRRPYSILGSTLSEQLSSQRGAEVAFPDKWPKSVPEVWRGLLEQLMAKDPEQRFESYDALAVELNKLAPVGVTNAGLLNRAMAYSVDLMFWGALLGIVTLPAIFSSELSGYIAANFADHPLTGVLSRRLHLFSLLAPLVPLAATYLQWRRWRTPGRYLFQLRVVDPHGLPLSRRKNVLRSLLRFAPLWGAAGTIVVRAMGLDNFSLLLAPVDEIIVLVNTIPVLGSARMALHDRLVGSHVVLDTHAHRHH